MKHFSANGAKITRHGGAPRIVLYSHDTVGFGHLRRNLLLAQALRSIEPRPDILMIAGMHEAGGFHIPEGVDMLTLPAYGKTAEGTYEARHLGLDLRTIAALRAETIKAALAAFDPDLMIVDSVPRGCQSELDPALHMLRKRGRARVILGLRDIIDSPETVRAQWLRQRNQRALRDWFDEIWIYGDRAFFDLPKEYGFSADFRARSRFMGYLDQRHRLSLPRATEAATRSVPDKDDRPFVLCAVGGGKDGADLCHSFARTTLPPNRRGIILTGTQMPGKDQAALTRQIGERDDMQVLRFLPEPISLFAAADRVITMGGYNTVCEALSFGKRSLIVPRTRPRREQVIRAERLSRAGAVDMLLPEHLSPDSLSQWLSRPQAAPQPARPLDMSGFERVRNRTAEILARDPSITTSSPALKEAL